MVKHLPTMQETRVQSLGWEDPLEKEMATHSSTLAWKIPWMEEYGRLGSMESQRVGQDWATSLSLFLLPFSLRPFLGSFFIKPLVWGLSHFSVHFATEVIILTIIAVLSPCHHFLPQPCFIVYLSIRLKGVKMIILKQLKNKNHIGGRG